MKTDFYLQVENSSASRAEREKYRNLVLRKTELLPELTSFAFTIEDKNHFKAFWILELVCEKKLKFFLPYIDEFCEVLPKLKNESAIRPASKITLFLAKSNHRANGIQLTQLQESLLIENCFDWLISDCKVASKVYAIKALYVLGRKFDWIHPELKNILEQNFHQQTPAYQSVSKNILKKLKF